ncbi:MAG TPA: PKD domain-containing protein [Conexibacter sp.]
MVLVLALVGTSVASYPVWLQPFEVVGGTEGVQDVSVAMNGGGDAVVVWGERNGEVHYTSVHASIRSDGVFGSPAELSPPEADGLEPRPQVVLDRAGSALALWERFPSTIMLARRAAGAGWGASAILDGPDPDVSNSGAWNPRVAVAPAGNALIAWTTSGGGSLVRAADVSVAGVFGPRTTISQPDDSDDAPRVAFGPSGEALLAWNDTAAGYVATVALRVPGEAFSAEERLSDPSTPGGGARPAIDAAGDAIVAWTADVGSDQVVQAAIHPAGENWWSDPIPLSEPAPHVGPPEIASAGDGTTTVVWSQSVDGIRSTIQGATRPHGGAFGRPIDLSALSQGPTSPQIAGGADGTTIVTWSHADGHAWTVQASTRSPGGAFGNPVDLSVPASDQQSPYVAVGDTGDALVAWHRWDGRRSLAEVAAYDASPPRIEGVTVPATARVGQAAHMAVAAADISSPVTTTWSFGDGSVAEGPNVVHAYQQPGSYEVRVVATDTAGGTAVSTRRLGVERAPGPLRPHLSRLRLEPAVFRASAPYDDGVRALAGTKPTGSHVRFGLDMIAKVSFAVERRTHGRQVHGRCVKLTHGTRGAKPCVRLVPVRGSFTQWAAPGASRIPFGGRLNGHALRTGRYVLVATPTSLGIRGSSARAPFRIRR